MQSLKIAYKNVFRNRRRSLTTVLIAGIGMAAMVSAAGFAIFTYDSLRDADTQAFGHFQLSHRDFRVQEEEKPMQFGLADHARLRSQLQKDNRVRALFSRVQLSGLISNGDKSVVFFGGTIGPEEFAYRGENPTIVEGNPLSKNPDPNADYEVILGNGLARSMGATVGSSLTLLSGTTKGALNAIDVRVTGIFRTGVRDLDGRLVYVHVPTAQQLLSTDKVSTVAVYLTDNDKTIETMKDVGASYPELKPVPWWDLSFFFKPVSALYNRLFGVLGLILVVLVFFSVSNTMSMNIMERTREIGTLAALGAFPHELVRNFVLEATVIGGFGVTVGTLVGVSLSILLGFSGIEMPPPPGRVDGYPLVIVISPVVYLVVSVVVVLTCVAAAYVAARRGVKKPIVEALAYV